MTSLEPAGQTVGHVAIAAHSKRQAMDWSLVLASQGIQPLIEFRPEANRWELLIDESAYQPALSAIRQYRLENRGWAWRQQLPGAELDIHAGAILWCFLLVMLHWIGSEAYDPLTTLGRMDSLLVPKGEWWRLFTAVTLHADLAHLLANVSFGALILGLAMARFGAGIALLLTFLAGVAGNLLGFWLYPHPYTGVGASGMMMGALGLLCVHSVGLWRRSPKAARYISSGVLAGFLLFVLFGLNPASDILAHVGGFAGGIVAGTCLAFIPDKILHNKWLNGFSFVSLAALLTVVWMLAFKFIG